MTSNNNLAANTLKKKLRPGVVYHRKELESKTNSLNQELNELTESGKLIKVHRDVYYYPKMTRFGPLPPDDHKLIKAFLNDDSFLITSKSYFNGLNVGTTQLYNELVVYNHKRKGKFKLHGKNFTFLLKQSFPKRLSREFLLVDLVDNIHLLAEDQQEVLNNVKQEVPNCDEKSLARAVKKYGAKRSKDFFSKLLPRL